MRTNVQPADLESQPVPPGVPGRNKRGWYIAAAVVGVVVLLGGYLLWSPRDEDDGPDGAVAPSTSSPTPTNVTTTTSTPTTDDATVMWPFPGSGTRFATPQDAARSYATSFLRFRSPVVGAFQAGDSRSGEVPVRPRSDGPVTTVLVRQVGSGEDWSVLGAAADTIEVAAPDAGDEVSSPVEVSGRAHAFEGHVDVEVRVDGELGPIGAGFVTGGGDEMRPFQGSVPFETPGEPFGAVVFFTTSAENGEVWQASAVRVAFRSTDIDAAACGTYRSPRPELDADEMEVKAYFTCEAGGAASLFPVYRAVPKSPGVLKASLEALLAGPTAPEKAASVDSWFSAATEDMLRSVTITGGHAVVDFDDLRPVIPNASASAGSDLLLSQLDATVFQFRSVESVEYRIEGSCEDFTEWLQYGGCDPRQRGVSED